MPGRQDGPGREGAGLHGEGHQGDHRDRPRQHPPPARQTLAVVGSGSFLGHRPGLTAAVPADEEEDHHRQEERDRRS